MSGKASEEVQTLSALHPEQRGTHARTCANVSATPAYHHQSENSDLPGEAVSLPVGLYSGS